MKRVVVEVIRLVPRSLVLYVADGNFCSEGTKNSNHSFKKKVLTSAPNRTSLPVAKPRLAAVRSAEVDIFLIFETFFFFLFLETSDTI